MGITVDNIYKRFPQFKPEDMEKLVGRSNFNDNTQISLNNISKYRGSYDQDLSVFTAQKEGNNFINLLSGKKKINIAEDAGITLTEPAQTANTSALRTQNAQNDASQNNQQKLGLLSNNNNQNMIYKPLNYLA